MSRRAGEIVLNFFIVCQNADEAGGALNFYGVYDSLLVRGTAERMPMTTINLMLAVGIYAQDHSQTYPARLTMQPPGGTETEIATFNLGNDEGRFVGREIMPFGVDLDVPGLYLLRLYLDGELRGQSPLSLRYEREFVH